MNDTSRANALGAIVMLAELQYNHLNSGEATKIVVRAQPGGGAYPGYVQRLMDPYAAIDGAIPTVLPTDDYILSWSRGYIAVSDDMNLIWIVCTRPFEDQIYDASIKAMARARSTRAMLRNYPTEYGRSADDVADDVDEFLRDVKRPGRWQKLGG